MCIRDRLSAVAPPILASALPYIIAADWNAAPSALAASGFLAEMGACAAPPQLGTCLVAGETS
eukprot:9669626-Prorocentrum_lima.AAC.1